MSNTYLVESSKFPIDVVNSFSIKEKRGGKPPHWETVFWWTRKPLVACRSAIAGAVLPASTAAEVFAEVAGLNAKTPHRVNPRVPPELAEKLRSMSLLDPFAGFGSIPLEAIRLGLGRVVAVELLPTAYVFLKAVLEYPVELGRDTVEIDVGEAAELGLMCQGKTRGRVKVPLLVYDVARWGRWVVERLREDPDVRELYDEDVAIYIGTWEVRCPICGRYTPLVGNWWLAKTKEKHAYMKPAAKNDEVEIEVVEKRTGAPEPNVGGRPEYAKCLLCTTEITHVCMKDGKLTVVAEDSKPEGVEVEFYPKLALRDWNKRLEQYLTGAIRVNELRGALARPRLLVKVRIAKSKKGKKSLVFEPATREDNERLWRALERLKEMWGDPDIPTEELWKYHMGTAGQLSIWVWGYDKFYKLFNPRQLLTLVKLVKLIREAGRQVKEEKLKQGWDKQKAHKYAEAVTTYLATALVRYAEHTSLVTPWTSSTGFGSTMALKPANVMTFRGIAMVWNWCETTPFINFAGSYIRGLEVNAKGLRYLVNAVSGSSSRVVVVLDDATVLGRLGDEKFDLIVTDPPYRDDVAYAELSDFYYVWLKRALREYRPEAFRYNTQWEGLSVREVSYSEGRLKYFLGETGADHYVELLKKAFAIIRRRLRDGGLVAVFFAHSSPEAWRDLVDAAWGAAGLELTVAYPVATESEERVTARGKTALSTSILTVWRPRRGGVAGVDAVAERARQAVREFIASTSLRGADLFFASFVKALSAFTAYDRVEKTLGAYLSTGELIQHALRIAAEEIVGSESRNLTPVSLAYALIRKLYGGSGEMVLSSQELILLNYAVTGEKRLHLLLREGRIAEPVKEAKGRAKGSKVAKQKTYRLIYPLDETPEAVREVAGRRRIDLVKLCLIAGSSRRKPSLANAVDVLHVMEYYALQTADRFASVYASLLERYPMLTAEAEALARALSTLGDAEGALCRRMLNMLRRIREV